MTDMFELQDRQIIAVPGPPPIRHIGVALDHDEAQAFIAKGFQVFGDEEGPYLVIRVRGGQVFVADCHHATVTFEAIRWHLRDERSGIICWLESAA